jgi:outer membrane receptor for ferrienterochelin and colicin
MKSTSWLLRALLSLVVLGFAAPDVAVSQGVTTSAITGRVTDELGQPLSGIQIVATNVATGRTAGIITRADGRYLLPGLQPGGPYRIETRGLGYTPQVRENVQLALGQTADFSFSLAQQAIAIEGLAVTADRSSVISAGRTGAGAVVGQETIERSPTITRDFTDFTRLVPQISTGGAGTQAAGRNNRFNNIQIDGAVNNDLFGLAASGTPGGQAGARPITLEAIQEFQVVLAPMDVRQGGFTGAGINAVTRSGTNNFRGTVAYFGRNQDFVGRYNVPGADTAAAAVSDFSQSDLAFSLGGPIIRDRAHFFLAGELSRRTAPQGFVIGGPNVAINAADAQRVQDVLRTQYGHEAGTFGDINLGRDSNNLFGRLDFTINPNHRLTVRHNFVDAGDDNLSRSNFNYRLGDNIYQFQSVTNSSVAQLNSTIANRFFNEFRFGFSTVRDQRSVATNFPAIFVAVPGGRIGAGHENFSGANQLDQDVVEITNDFTIPLGTHNITIGTSNQFFRFSNLFARNVFGYYEFANIDALVAGTPNRYEFSYVLPGGNERAEFPVQTWSAYVQDQWSVLQNFRLTGGIRLEMPVFPDSPALNTVVAQTVTRDGQPVRTDEVPSGRVLFNPRIGFNWDVLSDQTTQVRGGVGFFSGRAPGVWISNAYGNTGLDYARFTCTGAATPRFEPNPLNQPRNCAGATTALAPSEINTIDPSFDLPQVLRYSLGIDRQLAFGVIGTLEGLYTQSVSDVLPQELLLGAPAGTIEGRTRWTRQAAPFTNVMDITNTDQNRTYNLTAQLQRRFLTNWEASAAYTFSRSEDVNSTTSSQAFSNWRFNPIRNDPNNPELTRSNFDVPHRFILSAAYEANLLRRGPTEVSFVFVGESGRPYSYTYSGGGANGDVNFDGSNGNDLVYVPTNASDIRFTGTAEQQAASWNNLNGHIESVQCLREARGTVLERNSCREPWSNRLDLRLAQTIPTFGAQNFQLTLDILNFGNMLNREWGLSRFVPNQNDNTIWSVSNRNPDANGRILMNPVRDNPSVLQVSNLGSRYQIQLGGRYVIQ